MRTRALFTALMLMLTWAAASSGCQIVSGLTVLQVTAGSGGDGSGGAGGGAECATATDCGASSECGTYTCDSAGKCHRDDASYGTPCGAGCGDGVAISAGICDGSGKCAGQVETPCTTHYGCDLATKECNSHCTSFDDCSSNSFCVTPNGKCAACGVFPPDSPACMTGAGGCETCDGDLCVETCDAIGECNGSTKVVNAGMGAARLVCNGQCNGITVNCVGPFPCEVVCDSNGCNDLTVNCSNDGPCKITCSDTGCTGKGVIMNCGENECGAKCTGDSSAKVDQACGGSCGCTKKGCQ
jgi:hypothetical protein